MTTNEKGPATRLAIHPELESVALLDIDEVCAVAGLSKSYVLDEIANARGPKPIRLGTRCTRYQLTNVRDWLAALIAAADSEGETETAIRARMTHAAKESLAKRRAQSSTAR